MKIIEVQIFHCFLGFVHKKLLHNNRVILAMNRAQFGITHSYIFNTAVTQYMSCKGQKIDIVSNDVDPMSYIGQIRLRLDAPNFVQVSHQTPIPASCLK